MRRLLVIPGILFGLFFAGGGFFIASESVWPMWQNWQRMQHWQPARARLLSISGSDSETLASYRYEYGGRTHTGFRVGVSEVNDNIGSWHRDMQAYLARIRDRGGELPIWVDPENPARAVIDREMRWGLFALSSGFCSIFVLIGLGAVYASIRGSERLAARRRPSLWDMRKRWQQAKDSGETSLDFIEFAQQHYAEADSSAADQKPVVDWQSRSGWEDERIASDAGKGTLIFWGFAIFWNAVSTPVVFVVPDELARGEYAVLLVLLFPLVGLFLVYKALQRTLEYRRFGKVPLHLDPYPGAIGGHVGGSIQVRNLDYRRAIAAESLTVTLECVYSYVSGSGKNRSRRESIKWAERGRPRIDNAIEGVTLSFRFDVPENLPEADVEQSGAYHFWRLGVNAEIPGVDLDRQYNIPVFATGARSRGVGHDISAQFDAERKKQAEAAGLAIARGQFDIDGLSRALRFEQQGNEIRLRFPMFRNRLLTLFAAVFAGGFGFASFHIAGMIADGGLFGILMVVFGIPFFLVALLAAVATVYLPLNNLSVSIRPGEISVLRRLLILPVYRRRLQRGEISRLGTRRSGSTGQGIDKIEHYKIFAELRQGGKVTLAEDIDGEDVAGHLRDYLAQRIGVAAE